jgi:hypothetical protein
MGKKQILVRVDSETKQGWEEAVENNPEYQSLNHLVRISVHRELTDGYVHKKQLDGLDISGSIEDDLLDEMREQLSSIVTQLEANSAFSGDNSEVADLASTLYQWLPRVHPDDIEEWLGIKPSQQVKLSDEEAVSAFGRTEDIVDHVPESDWDVRKALSKTEEISHVKSATDTGGYLRYFRVDSGAEPVADAETEHDVTFEKGSEIDE